VDGRHEIGTRTRSAPAAPRRADQREPDRNAPPHSRGLGPQKSYTPPHGMTEYGGDLYTPELLLPEIFLKLENHWKATEIAACMSAPIQI
jgi:hypothetical protein